MDAIAEQFDKPLFKSNDERNKEIAGLLKAESALPWPKEYLEVKSERSEIENGYPYPLFVGDDPHHSGHWTEKALSLLNFTSEAYLEISSELAKELGVENGESVKVESPVGKIIEPVRVSEILDNNVVLIPHNLGSTPVTSLMMRKKRLDSIRIIKLEE